MKSTKFISVVTPCYNEEANVQEVYARVKAVFEQQPQYRYEHIFCDNDSIDRTVDILRDICKMDKNVKVIVNSRNFGHTRSPYHGLLQASGDCVFSIVADLQDPPELIPQFLDKWEEGYKVVVGVKAKTKDSFMMGLCRTSYYWLVGKLGNIDLIPNYTGFGLYDRIIIDELNKLDDHNPYFRGIVADIGFPICKIAYDQPERKRGVTKNNFYTLYDLALLGITTHSRIPLRIATIGGFIMSVFALLISLAYLIAKIILWNKFDFGMAPELIGIYFFGSVQLFFIGILGEYIGNIYTQILKRPLVVEKERINF
ncbi:MAG: glycosyltransferase family 2 protein [Negativicutes bacterium]